MIRWNEFLIAAADPTPTQHVHIAFGAPSRQLVDRAWQACVDAGYGTTVLPGATPVQARLLRRVPARSRRQQRRGRPHDDVRPGNNVDHLWVGVRDLEASRRFYDLISRFTGIRPGRRWEAGVQYRGAWATCSFVGDGRRPPSGCTWHSPRRTAARLRSSTAPPRRRATRTTGAGRAPEYHPGYYAAFVLAPDGTNVESVFHGPGLTSAGQPSRVIPDVTRCRSTFPGNLSRMATADEHRTIAPIVGPDDPRRFTDSGIEIKPLYTEDDLPEELDERLGEPGEYPFTRGVHPQMYRRQLWTMRQYAGYASAKESNERYRYLLENGSTGLTWLSTCRRSSGSIPTTRDVSARSGAPGSRSTRSTTCARRSTRSRSTMSRRR